MRKQLSDLSEWEFDIDEISAGVYRVIGNDRCGHRLSFTGVDPDVLIEQFRSAVVALRGASVDERASQDD